jgi:RND family efflux transporter MFP subunit
LAEDVAQPWLALQCQTLAGASHGLVVRGGPELGVPSPIAQWPKTEAEAPDLLGVARAALVEGRAVMRANDPPAGSTRCWSEIALPFGPGSPFGGAVAVRIEHRAESADRARKRAVDQLQSGAAWLEGLLRSASTKDRLVTVLEVVATALEQERLGAAATAVATELAARLDCERVSIGLSRRGQMRAEALSNTAKFDVRSNLVRDLEAAMDEAADQDVPVIHPPLHDGPTRVSMAHEALVRSHGADRAWSVPLGSEGRGIGAMTFERLDEARLDAATIELCEDCGALLGPILDLKRRAGESWLEETRDFFRRQLANLRGPGHPQLKAAAIGCVAALLLLFFANGDYRITADATLEGRVQRAIVAGVDGFIAEANVRAGDLLREGQILGRLDDRDLLLQRREGSGKRAQLVEKHWKALAEHDRSQANLLSARIDQATAELDLVAAQLERTRLIAPFDGIVVKGDLSQSLGSPVERGELLFEVAPLDGYRIILEVDQRDIAGPAPGQRGQLALTALPGQALPLTVRRVTPVSIAEDGRNYFRVEAHLDEPVPGLRPGMEGVAKIEVGRRRLIWIWTHSLTDWLRLWTWSWLP